MAGFGCPPRLDEPLQQNPDDKHRDLFIDFLISDTAKALKAQTIVFTWLHPPELARLKAGGVRLVNPDTDHFLKLLAPPEPEPKAEKDAEEASSAENASAPKTKSQ